MITIKRYIILFSLFVVGQGISLAQTDNAKEGSQYSYSLFKYFRETSYYWIEEMNQEYLCDSNLTIQVRTTSGEPLGGLRIFVDTLTRPDISSTRTIDFITDKDGVVVIPKAIREKCVGDFKVQALPGIIGLNGSMSDHSDMSYDKFVPIKIHVVLGIKRAIGYKILSDVPIPNDVLSSITIRDTEKIPKELKKYKKHISVTRFVLVDLNDIYM